jgi:uncharacterized protein (TIGR02246 family)
MNGTRGEVVGMTTVDHVKEIEAIRAVVADAEALQSDAEGFRQLLTEDVALVNFGGRRVLGSNDVYQAMRQALETPFADVYTRNEVVDVRYLRPDVALVSCIKHISDERESSARDASAPLSERGSLTFVLVKQQGTRLIALSQTTPIAV